MAILSFLYLIVDDMFFAAIPAIGFALIFRTPPSALKYVALIAAIGHCTRTILMHFGISGLESGTFIASICVGFMGVYWSQHKLAHPKVITVAGVIPMIPGIYAYKTMIAIVQINSVGFTPDLWTMMVENLVKTLFLVGALAIGLSMPGLLFYRGKPVI